MSLFSLRMFGGILPDIVDLLLSSALTSFAISTKFTALNLKLPIKTFSLMSRMI